MSHPSGSRDRPGTGTSRREFLKRSAVAAGALGLGACSASGQGAEGAEREAAACGTPPPPRADKPLRILILGGTGFIGPHQVEYALARGHHITLFNRGKTNPGLFPGVEKLRGDRNGDLASLEGKRWDVCIDNSASNYKWVRLSAGLLKDAVHQYIYVSSISAYSDFSHPGMDVDAPTYTYETAGVSPDAEKLPYGLQKALSEKEAEKALPGRTTIVRPGLIVGPRDTSDRFTYWPVRIQRGGEVLAPGTPDDPTQIIDARDLTGWMIRLAENDTTGIFNATGRTRGMAELLYGIHASVSVPATFTWVDAAFLAAHDVKPWSDMPVWIPPTGDMAGFGRIDIHRAVDAGLTFRPLGETTRDTLAWWREQPADRQASPRAGLEPAREAKVLAAWHAAAAG